MDVCAIRSDYDPFHQEPDDPRLLGGEQAVPKRIELLQRLTGFAFRQIGRLDPRRHPGSDHDLRLAKECPDLSHDRALDLGGRDTPYDLQALVCRALQHRLGYIVPIEPSSPPRVGW